MTPPATSVDLNADVGEAVDDHGSAIERALLAVVTSINVACGGHAGDVQSMRATVGAALPYGVGVGAHPSYPDRAGFGRLPMAIPPGELEASIRSQLRALSEVCASLGSVVQTVKPHGALYAEVARGGDALHALLVAMSQSCAPGTAVVLPAGSAAIALCRAEGVPVRAEGYCDRAYAPDGSLVDREVAGAVFSGPAQAARQAVDLASGGSVDTLCIHADSPGAVRMAEAVRAALRKAGIAVAAPS